MEKNRMKFALVLNPKSRSGRGKKLWSFWIDELKKLNIDFDTHITSSSLNAIEIVKNNTCTIIVAVGGDGTINQVINGIMLSKHPKLLGILYAGTSPDFCKFHKISVNPLEALKILIKQKTKNIDLCRITYTSYDKKKKTDYFTCGCNIGFGADVSRFANKWKKFLGDFLSLVIGILKTLITIKTFKSVVYIDGEKHLFKRTNHIFILKNPYISSKLKLNINSLPNDGTMNVIIFKNLNKFQMMMKLPELYSGKAVKDKKIFLKSCTSVKVDAEIPREIEFDGDPKGFTDLKVIIIPKALKLIC